MKKSASFDTGKFITETAQKANNQDARRSLPTLPETAAVSPSPVEARTPSAAVDRVLHGSGGESISSMPSGEGAATVQILGDDWDALDDGDTQDVLHDWPSDRIMALQSALKVAPWHNTSYRMQTVRNAMTGEEISEWLQAHNFVKSSADARHVGSAMLSRGMFYQLNKKKKRNGFFVDATFKYTQFDGQAKEHIFTLLTDGVASRAISGAQVGVKYDKKDHLVLVLVEERSRRPRKGGTFSGDLLTPIDPPEFSMPLEEVPVPPVGDAPPDECEWLQDWEVVITENTDGAGWQYGFNFKAGSVWHKELTSAHVLRKREWRRPARRRCDEDGNDGAVEEAEGNSARTNASEGLPSEEAQRREMLMKAAQRRVPRSGFMELKISHGRDLIRVCDSVVTVTHGDVSEQSELSKKCDEHHWNFVTFLSIPDDMEPIKVEVWQVGTLTKQFLGEAEVFIPEFALCSTPGSLALQWRPDVKDRALDRMGETVGSIVVEWTFTVDENNNTPAAATKEGAAVARRSPAVSGGRRVILDLFVLFGDGITLRRRRSGPCGGFAFKRKKPRVFLRALYRGEYCNMLAESTRVALLASGRAEFAWHASLPLVPTAPLCLQVVDDEGGDPIGHVVLTHQPPETRCAEFEEVMPLERPQPASPERSSAEVVLGKLHLRWRWLIEQDPQAALLEAAEAERARRVQKMQNWGNGSFEDRKRASATAGGPATVGEARVSERVPVFNPRQLQQEDLLQHW